MARLALGRQFARMPWRFEMRGAAAMIDIGEFKRRTVRSACSLMSVALAPADARCDAGPRAWRGCVAAPVRAGAGAAALIDIGEFKASSR
jgi:hypothetical protein